jgi:hypothetical protein
MTQSSQPDTDEQRFLFGKVWGEEKGEIKIKPETFKMNSLTKE